MLRKRNFITLLVVIFGVLIFNSCKKESSKPESNQQDMGKDVKIMFLHHSTGGHIWKGGVSEWFKDYNTDNKTNYNISETNFPTQAGYGWKNYPYDYWNIWVKNAGNSLFKGQKTLEMLTKEYNVIVWKHCYPVCDIVPDNGNAKVESEIKTIANYKLQYEALKTKMKEFPNTKFIVWTGAVKVEMSEANAKRTKEFFDWVKNTWDEKNDNIYVWDFYQLETEGGLLLKTEYANNDRDSHPNDKFSKKVAPLFCNRIVDVIKGKADNTSITGK